MKAALVSVRTRFASLDRSGRRSGVARLPLASTVWALTMIGTAAATWDSSWRLRSEVDRALSWSAQQVLDGQLARTVSATILTRDVFMLGSLLLVTVVLLRVLERLTSTSTALSVWVGGAIWGYVGTTIFLWAGSSGGWDLATATLATSDSGPSAGTAALSAAIVVLMRHRLVTTASVAILLIGSAAHHQVADVEHIISFGSVLLVAPLMRRRRHPPTEPSTGRAH